MIKTLPKAIKLLGSFVIALIAAGVGWRFAASPLLSLSAKVSTFLTKYLPNPPPLEKIDTAFRLLFLLLCVALYIFILWAGITIVAWVWVQRFKRIGLTNPQGETPRKKYVRKHKNNALAAKGWIAYGFAPFGLSRDDFFNKSGRLVGIFRGKIGLVDFTHDKKFVEVEILPWRKIVPYVFQLFDTTERRQTLIRELGFASLVVGAPNGGKTYCMLTLAANYAAEDYTIVWLNRKGADVEAFRGCPNYYEADYTATGWQKIFERLRLRERHEESEIEKSQKFLLVFDEYQSYVARLDNKEKATFLQGFMTYIAMSRSLGFKTLIGTQAAYSEDMPKGARDMFANIIMMGNLAKTAKGMYLEADMTAQVVPVRQQGGGNIYHAADNSIEPLQVAPMVDEATIMRLIAEALNRPLFLTQNVEDDRRIW
jgi:hypothetical protein